MGKKFDKAIADKIATYETIISDLRVPDAKKKIIKASWSDSIRLMELLTRKYYIRCNILTMITIVSGILVPVTINFTSNPLFTKISATALGLLASISAGINQSYRLDERWKHYRKIAEQLKIEGEHYLSLSGSYISFSEHNGIAFKMFMSNVGLIKEAQVSDFFKRIVNDENKEQEINKKKNENADQDALHADSKTENQKNGDEE